MVGFVTCVLLVHYFKGSTAEYFGFMGVGLLAGAVLNRFLSTGFFADPSFFALILDSIIVAVGLILVFKMVKKPFEEAIPRFRFERIRFMFLGVSLISLLFALFAFINLVQAYMGLLPWIRIAQENAGVLVNFAVFVNFSKSLFLTGLFSFLERFSLTIEDTRRP